MRKFLEETYPKIVHCEDCRFSKMHMNFVDDERWFQTWRCRNPIYATKENPVNKPFVHWVPCVEQNKDRKCPGFCEKEKTFWQKITGR